MLHLIREVYFAGLFNMVLLYGIALCVVAVVIALFKNVFQRPVLTQFLVNGINNLLLIICSIVSLLAVILYSLYSNFVDHAEPQIVCTAANYLFGGEIYPSLSGENITSVAYGPMLYLVTSVGLRLFGSSIIVSKLPGVFAGVISCLIVFILLRRQARFSTAINATLWYLSVALCFLHALIWTRSDSYLTCISALGLVAAFTLNKRMAGLAVGVLAGLASNFKIHGAGYLMGPLLVVGARFGWQQMVWALPGGLIGLGFPFLLPRVSSHHYIENLQIAAGHGLRLRQLFNNLQWLVFLIIPIFISIFNLPKSKIVNWDPVAKWLLTGVVGSGLVVAVIASKPGAGPWHLLPFLPSLFWLYFSNHEKEANLNSISVLNNEGNPLLKAAGISWLCVITLLVFTRHDDYIKKFWHSDASKVIEEISKITQDYRGQAIEMGTGDALYGPDYEITFYRPELIFKKQPYSFDASALMDLGQAGKPFPSALLARIEQGTTRLFLIPKGNSPFRQINFYTRKLLFPHEFLAKFEEKYRLIESRRYYDLWIYQEELKQHN